MSEMCFPYGSINHDRRYKSSDFRAYYSQMIGNGVYYSNASALKVREGGGMTVLLGIGGAFIEGVGYRNTSDLAFKLDTADGALSRIDRIVIRNDYKKRDTYAAVLKGTYSAKPQAAALTRNADAYEIAVADVLVSKGVVSIMQSDITDTRLNKDLCGIVTGLIQQADTTDIFNQFIAFFNDFKQGQIIEFNNWTENQKQEFIEWENDIKSILDGDTAGNILNLIGKMQDLETTEKGNLVGALNEAFRAGNEKKQRLVENLIAMGVDASTSDTWENLLDKVLDMTDTSEDTVIASVLLAAYTAHNAAGEQIIGVMPERAGVTVDATATTQDSNYTYLSMPEGHYDKNSKLRTKNSNLGSRYVKIANGAGTYDISAHVDNISKYTAADFICTTNTRIIQCSGYDGQSFNFSRDANISVSYDRSTGQVTVSNNNFHFREANSYGAFWVTGAVSCTGLYLLLK